MDLGNPSEIVVHLILIERMTYLSHQDGFHMVSIHWIEPMISRDISYQVVLSSPSYYTA